MNQRYTSMQLFRIHGASTMIGCVLLASVTLPTIMACDKDSNPTNPVNTADTTQHTDKMKLPEEMLAQMNIAEKSRKLAKQGVISSEAEAKRNLEQLNAAIRQILRGKKDDDTHSFSKDSSKPTTEANTPQEGASVNSLIRDAIEYQYPASIVKALVGKATKTKAETITKAIKGKYSHDILEGLLDRCDSPLQESDLKGYLRTAVRKNCDCATIKLLVSRGARLSGQMFCKTLRRRDNVDMLLCLIQHHKDIAALEKAPNSGSFLKVYLKNNKTEGQNRVAIATELLHKGAKVTDSLFLGRLQRDPDPAIILLCIQHHKDSKGLEESPSRRSCLKAFLRNREIKGKDRVNITQALLNKGATVTDELLLDRLLNDPDPAIILLCIQHHKDSKGLEESSNRDAYLKAFLRNREIKGQNRVAIATELLHKGAIITRTLLLARLLCDSDNKLIGLLIQHYGDKKLHGLCREAAAKEIQAGMSLDAHEETIEELLEQYKCGEDYETHNDTLVNAIVALIQSMGARDEQSEKLTARLINFGQKSVIITPEHRDKIEEALKGIGIQVNELVRSPTMRDRSFGPISPLKVAPPGHE